jgi:hypothetical protein
MIQKASRSVVVFARGVALIAVMFCAAVGQFVRDAQRGDLWRGL